MSLLFIKNQANVLSVQIKSLYFKLLPNVLLTPGGDAKKLHFLVVLQTLVISIFQRNGQLLFNF